MPTRWRHEGRRDRRRRRRPGADLRRRRLMGSAFGPDRSARAADREAPHAEKGMEMDKGHAGEPAADPVRGLAVADRGLALQLADTELERGRASTLRFRVAGAGGRPVRDFSVEHTKRMHVIVVRRDGQGFQHLHPTMDADGTWSVPLTLGRPAPTGCSPTSRHDGRAQTLAADLAVDGSANYEPLPAPATRRARATATRSASTSSPFAPAARPSCASPSAAAARWSGPAALPRRRRAPGRAARGRSGVPARASRRRAGTGFGPRGGTGSGGRLRPVHDRVPERRPLPALPPVQARRPRCTPPSSRRTWRDEHARAADHGHDLRVVREPRRAQAQPARRRQRDRQLRDREGRGRLRPRDGRAGAARRGRRGGRLPGRAAVGAERRG